MPQKPKTLGEYAKIKWMSIPSITKFTFAITLLFFIVIHLYGFTNKFMNHDDMLFSLGGAGITSGRWFKNLVCAISSTYSMPWINGLLSALYMAVSVCAVTALFNVQHKFNCGLIAALMASFPTIAATFSYMYTADAYILALALACLGAFVAHKFKFGWCLAAVLFALSLGIYQAYFGMAVALLVFSLLYEITHRDYSTKEIIIKCLQYLFSLLLGLVIYKITLDALLKIQNLTLSSYMGISSMWDVSIGELLERVKYAYKNFFLFYNRNGFDVFPDRTLYLHFSVLLFLGLELVYLIVKNKIHTKPFLLLITLLLTAIIPLSCTIIFVMSAETHMLMIYPIIMPMLAAVIMIDKAIDSTPLNVKGLGNTCICLILIISTLFFCYDNFILTNKAYLKMDIIFKQTYAFNLKLTERIERTEGYTAGMPVQFIGTVTEEIRPIQTGDFDEIHRMTGVESELSALHEPTIREFCQFYIGVGLPYPSGEFSSSIENNPAVQQMNRYPAEGSIQIIDGVVVVKFSN